jgi:hypothetical protein
MSNFLGDFRPGQTIRKFFNTRKADGTPITLAGTPVISIYKDGGTTESTAGVTRTVDFDGRTGLHLVVIDTSADGTFYAAGSDFELVITTGTVDGVSVVGTSLGKFSLANRSISVDASGRVDIGYVVGVAATPDPTTPVTLAGGAVASGTSPTSFTATIAGSTLSPNSGAYDGGRLIFQSGARNTEPREIATYTVSGGTATFVMATALTAAPGAGDTFVIG